MADFADHISDKLARFIADQPVFFVATAPADGRISLSPKGMDTLRVLSPTSVAYLDLTGSGNETAAHLAADGRITVMFCSFTRNPLILRLYGHGRMVQRGDADWADLRAGFSDYPGVRQIMVMTVASLQTSCGYAVPEMAFDGERPTLAKWAAAKGDDGLAAYRSDNNRVSIDGLPTGLKA